MLMEIGAVVLGCTVWTHVRSLPPIQGVQQPGEGWKLLDVWDTATGNVRLMQSERDGSWSVQSISSAEGGRATNTWFASEAEARAAFAGANENHPESLRGSPIPSKGKAPAKLGTGVAQQPGGGRSVAGCFASGREGAGTSRWRHGPIQGIRGAMFAAMMSPNAINSHT